MLMRTADFILPLIITRAMEEWIFFTVTLKVVRINGRLQQIWDRRLTQEPMIITTSKPEKTQVISVQTGKVEKANLTFISFQLIPLTNKDYYKDLEGRYTDGSKPMVGSTLILEDESGQIIRAVKTDANGKFSVNNVPKRENIKVSVYTDPETIPSTAKIEITNKANGKKTILERLEQGGFKFKTLPLEGAADLVLEDDNGGLPTITVMGKLEGVTDVAEKKVYVVDQSGKVIASTLTDRLGKFKFEELGS